MQLQERTAPAGFAHGYGLQAGRWGGKAARLGWLRWHLAVDGITGSSRESRPGALRRLCGLASLLRDSASQRRSLRACSHWNPPGGTALTRHWGVGRILLSERRRSAAGGKHQQRQVAGGRHRSRRLAQIGCVDTSARTGGEQGRHVAYKMLNGCSLSLPVSSNAPAHHRDDEQISKSVNACFAWQ